MDEETVRLRSHIAQYRSILELDEPVGRKLDFLTQELNRETNTIGSKCQELDITRIVVDMKEMCIRDSTTDVCLRCFGLSSLEDLPPVRGTESEAAQ